MKAKIIIALSLLFVFLGSFLCIADDTPTDEPIVLPIGVGPVVPDITAPPPDPKTAANDAYTSNPTADSFENMISFGIDGLSSDKAFQTNLQDVSHTLPAFEGLAQKTPEEATKLIARWQNAINEPSDANSKYPKDQNLLNKYMKVVTGLLNDVTKNLNNVLTNVFVSNIFSSPGKTIDANVQGNVKFSDDGSTITVGKMQFKLSDLKPNEDGQLSFKVDKYRGNDAFILLAGESFLTPGVSEKVIKQDNKDNEIVYYYDDPADIWAPRTRRFQKDYIGTTYTQNALKEWTELALPTGVGITTQFKGAEKGACNFCYLDDVYFYSNGAKFDLPNIIRGGKPLTDIDGKGIKGFELPLWLDRQTGQKATISAILTQPDKRPDGWNPGVISFTSLTNEDKQLIAANTKDNAQLLLDKQIPEKRGDLITLIGARNDKSVKVQFDLNDPGKLGAETKEAYFNSVFIRNDDKNTVVFERQTENSKGVTGRVSTDLRLDNRGVDENSVFTVEKKTGLFDLIFPPQSSVTTTVKVKDNDGALTEQKKGVIQNGNGITSIITDLGGVAPQTNSESTALMHYQQDFKQVGYKGNNYNAEIIADCSGPALTFTGKVGDPAKKEIEGMVDNTLPFLTAKQDIKFETLKFTDNLGANHLVTDIDPASKAKWNLLSVPEAVLSYGATAAIQAITQPLGFNTKVGQFEEVKNSDGTVSYKLKSGITIGEVPGLGIPMIFHKESQTEQDYPAVTGKLSGALDFNPTQPKEVNLLDKIASALTTSPVDGAQRKDTQIKEPAALGGDSQPPPYVSPPPINTVYSNGQIEINPTQEVWTAGGFFGRQKLEYATAYTAPDGAARAYDFETGKNYIWDVSKKDWIVDSNYNIQTQLSTDQLNRMNTIFGARGLIVAEANNVQNAIQYMNQNGLGSKFIPVVDMSQDRLKSILTNQPGDKIMIDTHSLGGSEDTTQKFLTALTDANQVRSINGKAPLQALVIMGDPNPVYPSSYQDYLSNQYVAKVVTYTSQYPGWGAEKQKGNLGELIDNPKNIWVPINTGNHWIWSEQQVRTDAMARFKSFANIKR